MNVLEMPFFNFLEKFILIFCSERVIALQHHVVKDSQGPHVCVDWVVVDFWDDLRSHVRGSATESVDCLPLGTPKTKPEIDQFDLLVSVQQYVFCLDVPVNDVQVVEVK